MNRFFWWKLIWLAPDTYAFAIHLPNTYAFVGFLKIFSGKHIRVCCSETKHIRVCSYIYAYQTQSTHIPHTYAFVPRSLANTYAFVVSRHQTHTRLSFPGTKHIRVWRSFQICQANTYPFVVKLEQTGLKFPKPTRPNRNPSNGCRRTFLICLRTAAAAAMLRQVRWMALSRECLQRSPKAYIF